MGIFITLGSQHRACTYRGSLVRTEIVTALKIAMIMAVAAKATEAATLYLTSPQDVLRRGCCSPLKMKNLGCGAWNRGREEAPF